MDESEKKPVQKSCKSQKTAKSKKWIQVEKSEASRAKNLSSQLGSFFISKTKKAFTKLKQVFVEALILNHFNPKHHIQIEIDVSSYAISGIFSQLTYCNF